MPSPSKLSLIAGLAVTAGAFYGGAWLAAGLGDPNAEAPTPALETEAPLLPTPRASPTPPVNNDGVSDSAGSKNSNDAPT